MRRGKEGLVSGRHLPCNVAKHQRAPCPPHLPQTTAGAVLARGQRLHGDSTQVLVNLPGRARGAARRGQAQGVLWGALQGTILGRVTSWVPPVPTFRCPHRVFFFFRPISTAAPAAMYRQRGSAIATVREEEEDEVSEEEEEEPTGAGRGEEDGDDDGGELGALDDEGLSYSSGTGSDYTDEEWVAPSPSRTS